MWRDNNSGEFRISNGNHCPSLGGKYDQPPEAPEQPKLPNGNLPRLPTVRGMVKW